MQTGRNEAFSRILIDKALEYSRWNLLDPLQVQFEHHNASGRADYLHKDSLGRVLCVLEAKREDLDPYDAKEQARGYAENLNAPCAIRSCAYASHDCSKESSSAARRRVSVRGCLGMAERRKGAMSFWEGETCEYCDGLLMGRRVTLHRKIKGTYVLIENVPRGVCAECGTRYYAANVLKTIEESVRGRRKAGREILVPVYSL